VIDLNGLDDEGLGIDLALVTVFEVRGGRMDQLVNDARALLRQELKDSQRLLHALSADHVRDDPHLARRHLHSACYRSRFHRNLLLLGRPFGDFFPRAKSAFGPEVAGLPRRIKSSNPRFRGGKPYRGKMSVTL